VIYNKTVIQLSLVCLIVLLQSCFLVKIPLKIKAIAVKDTVNVYHFVVTGNSRLTADTSTTNSFSRESKKAFDWLTKEANKRGQNLVFKEYWLENKDSLLKQNFIHKLPSKSLQELINKKFFNVVTRKRSRGHEEKIESVNWKRSLFDSLAKQIKDTRIAKLLNDRSRFNQSDNKLFMVHLLKVKKSKFLGFYQGGNAFIGSNKSVTIAHETLHYLGAPDLYIHRYWFGKRRRIIKNELKQEVMDFAIGKNHDCTKYYISNYTAFTLCWDKKLDKQFTPILKQNLMAKFLFQFGLLF
jgi:hypothetical protein